ncbi:hypothetical protein Acr_18g0011270 [Actinidia rufa]|uniref:Glycine-rich protein n=1 Tax=Actinidia rufa TaxID=165716 RepID=A0A7J0G831_9ERIC|nr:hypothetical protein Acr_18g0011270 [Actinidia rufa]
MQGGRGGRDPFSDFGDPFARFGRFGGLVGHRSLLFGGRDPFNDPFFTCPFGSMFESSVFGPTGNLFTDVYAPRFLEHTLTLEESKKADTATGQATHQIARGIHAKGHMVTRKLNSDGRVNTMQTLHNLNEDELSGFEEAWKGNARNHLPGWNEGLNMHDDMSMLLKSSLDSHFQYGVLLHAQKLLPAFLGRFLSYQLDAIVPAASGFLNLMVQVHSHCLMHFRAYNTKWAVKQQGGVPMRFPRLSVLGTRRACDLILVRGKALLLHTIQDGQQRILEIVQAFLVEDQDQVRPDSNGGNQSDGEHGPQRNLSSVTVSFLGFCPHASDIAAELERAHPPLNCRRICFSPIRCAASYSSARVKKAPSRMSQIQLFMVEAEERAASADNEPIPKITLGRLLQKLNSMTRG